MKFYLKLCLILTFINPALSLAQVKSNPVRYDVIKVVSLSCMYCQASEAMDKNLELETNRSGGKYVVAPLALEGSDARERTYYSLRKLYPSQETYFRSLFYQAAMDQGLELSSMAQARAWIEQESQMDLPWTRIEQISKLKEITDSIQKALYLAHMGGVTTVPAWVILKNGTYHATVEVLNENFEAARNRINEILKDNKK